MDTGPGFWLAMFAASAFGTNLGDLWRDLWGDIWVGRLGMAGPVSFVSVVAVSVLAIWGDRRVGVRTEAAYWFAIVVLRAAATNVADYLTGGLKLGFLPAAAVFAALALGAGWRTRAGPLRAGDGAASPLIDGRYWAAMFAAGVFGTVGGDWMNHTVGVLASAVMLTALLAAVILARARWWPGTMLSYWVAVMAERSAGTPVGDGLASRHGAGLGVPVATVCTAALFAAALLWRQRAGRTPLTAEA